MKRKRSGSIDTYDDPTERFPIRNNAIGPDITPLKDLLISSEVLEDGSDCDSLFDADDDAISTWLPFAISEGAPGEQPALRTAPPIPGLYFDPSALLSNSLAERLWKDCMEMFFRDTDVNQVMLFERARSLKEVETRDSMEASAVMSAAPSSGLPSFLLELLSVLDVVLKDVVPPNVHTMLFPHEKDSGQARQVILNHYRPGEGITPHVDLLKRYDDGIIGVSLHSGTVIDFTKVRCDAEQLVEASHVSATTTAVAATESRIERHPVTIDGGSSDSTVDEDTPSEGELPGSHLESYSTYLPERSVFVLSGEARYLWNHGISKRVEDLVEAVEGSSSELLPRGERLSITFRWLLPGADIVGP